MGRGELLDVFWCAVLKWLLVVCVVFGPGFAASFG